MNPRIPGYWLVAPLLMSFACMTRAAEPSAGPSMPMPVNQADAAPARWPAKPVLASRLLDDMENQSTWSHAGGFGAIELTTERFKDGARALRLTSPTYPEKPVGSGEKGRPFGESIARRTFDNEDWRGFNRISLWVYPTLPGFRVITLMAKLHNDGEVKVPDESHREGLHYFLLEPDRWNQVIFEITHLARDRVNALEIVYRLQGNEPGATARVCYDLDRLELQKVEPDYYEGWPVAPGRIAYSHTGYVPAGTKTALASGLGAEQFQMMDAASGRVVLTRPVQVAKGPLGEFQVLDFTDFREPGRYVLSAGGITTRPFRIAETVWRDTIWKTINFYYCERCGFEVPGIHDVCHRDWQSVHGDRRIVINGGWHDAGDLSQGLINTAESAAAMFGLAERLRASDPVLSRRLIDEGRWGLDWLLRNRYGDGYRIAWATMDFWTDGILGTVDDVTFEAARTPGDNFTAAATEALAARVLKSEDPILAGFALEAAEQDWQWAVEQAPRPTRVELAAEGAIASLELFKVTGRRSYADKAVEFARIILECQQSQPTPWKTPLSGFFYASPRKDAILNFNHRAHYQAPVVALCELCTSLPDHADRPTWLAAVKRHAEYLQAVARFTEPYAMLPSGLYRLDGSDDRHYQAQARAGVDLGGGYALRRFPIWSSFRGNNGVLLSHARSLAAAARLLNDPALADLCQRQLQWVVGRNPFSQSLMYGEGYDYLPQYTAMSGDMTGSLPVGISTREDADAPYWSTMNCYNHKEVWVHPSARWLAILQDLAP